MEPERLHRLAESIREPRKVDHFPTGHLAQGTEEALGCSHCLDKLLGYRFRT
jgi:hypothetical protein